jgi:hypothetical protein
MRFLFECCQKLYTAAQQDSRNALKWLISLQKARVLGRAASLIQTGRIRHGGRDLAERASIATDMERAVVPAPARRGVAAARHQRAEIPQRKIHPPVNLPARFSATVAAVAGRRELEK